MDVAIMIEGQSGVTWPIWQRVAGAVERLGFAGLYRSDHFTNAEPPSSDALEAWVSLAWLASHTERIEFGPMVSPVSFREPVMLARMALAVDDLSGGRLRFGLGAGWQEREHTMFGYDLLSVPERMARFGEALEVVSLLLQSDAPVSFEGKYYTLRDALLLPRPQRPGGPPIVIGGNGPKYTLPLAARYAQEWNGVYLSAQRFGELQSQLDALIADAGRVPADVRRTLMTGLVFGRSDAEVRERATEWGSSPAELRARGIVVGTGADLAEQLHQFAAAGAQRVMLQWFNWDDMAELETIAEAIVPAFPSAR